MRFQRTSFAGHAAAHVFTLKAPAGHAAVEVGLILRRGRRTRHSFEVGTERPQVN
jgi:hypothetical protein